MDALSHTELMINSEWFRDRLKSIKLSQRGLAKQMNIDPAAVSYMLQGKRAMSMEEARVISAILLMPVTEVMRQAGIEVLDDVRKIPVKGFTTVDFLVTFLPKGTYDTIISPQDMPSKSFALQHRSSNSSMDGWMAFVSGEENEPHDMLDQYCYVALEDGTAMLAVVRKGYKVGTYNLLGLCDGIKVRENKKVAKANLVKWLMPM